MKICRLDCDTFSGLTEKWRSGLPPPPPPPSPTSRRLTAAMPAAAAAAAEAAAADLMGSLCVRSLCWPAAGGSPRGASHLQRAGRKGITFVTLSFHQAGLLLANLLLDCCFIPLLPAYHCRGRWLVGWNRDKIKRQCSRNLTEHCSSLVTTVNPMLSHGQRDKGRLDNSALWML